VGDLLLDEQTPIAIMEISLLTLDDKVVSSLLGLVGGVIGTFLAPWVNWGIETRRERIKARKQLIEDTRMILQDPPPVSEFRKLPIYFRIKPFLAKATINTIQGKYDKNGNEVITIVVGPPPQGPSRYVLYVLNDLSLQEIKWKLV